MSTQPDPAPVPDPSRNLLEQLPEHYQVLIGDWCLRLLRRREQRLREHGQSPSATAPSDDGSHSRRSAR